MHFEHYRTNQVIREGIEKKRIEVSAPLWTDLNALYFLISRKYNFEGLSANEKELKQLKGEITEKEDSTILNIRVAVFWLGEELFDKHMEYLDYVNKDTVT